MEECRWLLLSTKTSSPLTALILTAVEGWGVSKESVKKGKTVTKTFLQVMLNEVLKSCEKLCICSDDVKQLLIYPTYMLPPPESRV